MKVWEGRRKGKCRTRETNKKVCRRSPERVTYQHPPLEPRRLNDVVARETDRKSRTSEMGIGWRI